MIRVEIDRLSGFCGGVIRAIEGAEKFLDSAPGESLYSLGDIVHNEVELERLRSKGLVTIDREDLEQTVDAGGRMLLIRAHGEPPQTYEQAEKRGFRIMDFTCPVVLKLQQSIRETYDRMGGNGQIVIFGKLGHAEVLGLVGQVGGDAVVVEDLRQLQERISDGSVRTGCPVDIFSQTTMSLPDYQELCSELRSRMDDPSLLTVHDTICRQVSFRHQELSDFAASHDVIVFVSGRTSSNGEVLCNLCRSINIRTYQISDASELKPGWFRPDDFVGVSGATSTPRWLLEKVAGLIQNLH